MRIIHQSCELIGQTPCDPVKMAQLIEQAGRTCYKSEDKITKDSAVGFVQRMIKSEHHSVLEHSNIVFKIDLDVYNDDELIIMLGERLAFHQIDILDNKELFINGNLRAWNDTFKEQYTNTLLLHDMHYLFEVKFGFLFGNDHSDVTPSVSGIEIVTDEHDIPHRLRKYMTRHITNRAMCYDDQTEVLTKNGWLLFNDIDKNSEFLSFSDANKSIHYEKATNIINEHYSGKMIKASSKAVDFCVTPNHRMLWFHYDSRKPSWKIDQAGNIYGKRVKFQRGLPYEWIGKLIDNEYPQQNTLQFAKFLGVFITDGSFKKEKGSGGKITLSQTKNKGRLFIKKLLTELGWEFNEYDYGFVLGDTKLYNFLVSYFPKKERKQTCRVPDWVKESPKEYINAFIDGVIVGDGNMSKNGHFTIHTTNKKLIDDYQECVLKIGLCSSIRFDDRRGKERLLNGKLIKNNKICYILSITTNTNEHLFNKKYWKKIEYDGNIHCVTIPSGMLYVRRNGKAFWSGNSHEMVRHRIDSAYSQESQRYVANDKDIQFVIPVWADDLIPNAINTNILTKKESVIWLNSMEAFEKVYHAMRSLNLKPQQCREVLPNSCKTEIVTTRGFEAWAWFFHLRNSKAADPQMMALAGDTMIQFLNTLDEFKCYYKEKNE